jgi:subtilisin family serine protease
MIANGDELVNERRAEHSSIVACPSPKSPPIRGPGAVALALRDVGKLKKQAKLKAPAKNAFTNVFIDLHRDVRGPAKGNGQSASIIGELDHIAAKHNQPKPLRKGNIIVATVPIAELPKIAQRSDVAYVSPAEPIKFTPLPKSSDGASRNGRLKPQAREWGDARKHEYGAGVLIGIIDVQGFDFAHPDFTDKRSRGTRWVRIWDQGGDFRAPPSKFRYGSEFTQAHLNQAIKKAPRARLPVHKLEPQSQMAPGSHGTHVASIAAGNEGVCHNAWLAGVLIALPEKDYDRRKSFYDSSRIVHAIEYLLDLADELGGKAGPVPLSINISLGTNGDAHDASSPLCRWIDSVLATRGRSIAVAAGNAGQEAPATPDDLGWMMGRIHTSGKIPARGLDLDIDWVVVGNGIADISENELEIWYSAQDRFAISVLPPNSNQWIGPISEREYVENLRLPDGSFISLYNELYHPANGCNYISAYLSPNLDQRSIVGVTAGLWKIRLHGIEVRDGRFHGWIERDDPSRAGPVGSKEAWRFPSFFSERSNVDVSSVSSLACGQRVLSVANLDSARSKINITSSEGPTRDGRFKPDVAADGTDIVAANGFDSSAKWIEMTGTSMASPLVAGIAGLMLKVRPQLTAAQIGGIMQRTARPLPGSSYEWAKNAGFGAISPTECVTEAVRVADRTDRTKEFKK